MTRSEYIIWAKKRALECLERGAVREAFSSMASDLQKHPETAGHHGIQLGMVQSMSGMLSTPEKMRRFIEGFN